MRLLITRPAEDSKRLAKALAALAGRVEAVICPLMEIVPAIAAALPVTGLQGVIATSRNSLRALAGHEALPVLRALPIFCVGAGTAEQARTLGFADIHTGPGGAGELVPLIAAQAKPGDGPLLYLRGAQIAYDLGAALARHGLSLRPVLAYRAELAPDLPPALVRELRAGQIDGVVLMSPRMAAHFAALLRRHALEDAGRAMRYYCLSEAVARRLTALGSGDIRIPARPDQASLVMLIGADATAEDTCKTVP